MVEMPMFCVPCSDIVNNGAEENIIGIMLLYPSPGPMNRKFVESSKP